MLQKLNKYLCCIMLFSMLFAQFKEVSVSFDNRLLRADEKTTLLSLNNNIKKFYENSVWNDEYSDLELNLDCLLYTSPSPRDLH